MTFKIKKLDKRYNGSDMFKVSYNLHGHIHQNQSPTPQHINCCVEVQDYTPKSIEQLVPV